MIQIPTLVISLQVALVMGLQVPLTNLVLVNLVPVVILAVPIYPVPKGSEKGGGVGGNNRSEIWINPGLNQKKLD